MARIWRAHRPSTSRCHLEVGMGVHGIKIAHHIDVALQSAVGGDGACVVGTGFEFMFGA